MHPKVEVAGQPITTQSTSEAVQLQQASTAPTVPPSVALQHPSKLQPEALQQQPTPSGRHL